MNTHDYSNGMYFVQTRDIENQLDTIVVDMYPVQVQSSIQKKPVDNRWSNIYNYSTSVIQKITKNIPK